MCLLAKGLIGCTSGEDAAGTRFQLLDKIHTGIDFQNSLAYTEEINPYTYKSFYNGAGVGLGDLNNDGLVDCVFAGNLVANKVYLNEGDFLFKEITSSSGLDGGGGWTTGVALADVNGDGRLDVYLSKSGPPDLPNRRNELRINQGDGTFVDIAAEAGVDNLGFAVQAAFFDYDLDGDLDFYLLNNSITSVGGYDLRQNRREIPDSLGGNKLYQNQLVETGEVRFSDVTEQAGIFSSAIGFGLGVAVADLNHDRWPDLYISNDFFERDYLYLNNRNGTFREVLPQLIQETSLGAMGADIADLDNDGRAEIFVSEMLPRSEERYLSTAVFESFDKRRTARRQGYHNQFTRNTLLTPNHDSTYSEISRLAGVEASDWSWGALAADLDNDGLRDIFVANGIFKDLLNQDYVHYVANDENIAAWVRGSEKVLKRLVDSIPSNPQPNVIYRNQGELLFVDSAAQWGFNQPSSSSGSAYGDLDNDGDLDLIISNINDDVAVYRNNSSELYNNAGVVISLRDPVSIANRFAVGASVEVYANGKRYTSYASPYRGFMSSSDPRVHVGISHESIDSIIVVWPTAEAELFSAPQPNVVVELVRGTGEAIASLTTLSNAQVLRYTSQPAPFVHIEDVYLDWTKYPFIPEMLSARGPCLAVATLREEHFLCYFGGAAGQAGEAWELIGTRWSQIASPDFADAAKSEDVAAAWLDIDRDGDLDLIVCAGGDQDAAETLLVKPRVYMQTHGQLRLAPNQLPSALDHISAGAIQILDANEDGAPDLIFGADYRLGLYGLAASSYLLLNDGRGKFSVAQRFEGLDRVQAICLGHFTSADGPVQLAIAQDYGPITVYAQQDDGTYAVKSRSIAGRWRALAALDLDGDGVDELIAGNYGCNTRFKASAEHPVELRIGDFDDSGSLEHLPVVRGPSRTFVPVQLSALVKHMPRLRKMYPRFKGYASAPIEQLAPLEKTSIRLQANELRSGILKLCGADTLCLHPFAQILQVGPIAAIAVRPQLNGQALVYVHGNNSYVQPEYGGSLAHVGRLLVFTGEGLSQSSSVLVPSVQGEVRAASWLGNRLLLVRNNAAALLLSPSS